MDNLPLFFYVITNPIEVAGNMVKFKFVYDKLGPHILVNEHEDTWVFWSDFGIRSEEDLIRITVEDLQLLEKEFVKGVRLLNINAKFTRGLIPPMTK